MKKKYNHKQVFIILLSFLIFCCGTFFNKLQSQEISPIPQLTILKAELGIFDNNLKNEEYVAFKNSPITNPYSATIKDRYKEAHYNWLELDPTDNKHLDLTNPKLNRKNAIFSIKKIFPPDTDLEKLYNAFIVEQWSVEDSSRRNFTEQYLKGTQYAGGTVPYKFNYNAVQKIYNELKEKERAIGKDKFNLKKELPFKSPAESEILKKHLSPYEEEKLRRENFIHQYKIRDYEINDQDLIHLSPISTGDLIGFTHYYWGMTAYNTCIPQKFNGNEFSLPPILLETTKWRLTKVTKTNESQIKSGTTERVYIESACPNPNRIGWKIQRFFWSKGTGRALVLEPGKEHGGYAQNAYFLAYHIGPPSYRLTPENCPILDVTQKLKNLVVNKKGLKNIEDGIIFPRSNLSRNWKEVLGNPCDDNSDPLIKNMPQQMRPFLSGWSNLWMQLKVTYRLGRKVYTHTFKECEENIQIPTRKELEEEITYLKETQKIYQDLKILGFIKAPKQISQISANGKQVIGRDSSGIVKWNYDKKDWQSISQTKHFDAARRVKKSQFNQLAIISDGTVFSLEHETLYQLKEGKKTVFDAAFSKNVQCFSLSDLNNFWVIKDGIVYKNNNGKWNQFVKNKKMIYIATASDKTTYALDKDGNIFKWTGAETINSDDIWIKDEKGPKLKQISVGSKEYVYGIDKENNVWKIVKTEWKKEPLIKKASFITVNNFGDVWILIKDGKLVFYKIS